MYYLQSLLRFCVSFCFLLRRSVSGKELCRLLYKFLLDKARCLQNHRYTLKTRSFSKSRAICLSRVLKEGKLSRLQTFPRGSRFFL